ncbi:MAG: hypothetical protein D6719_04530 [Candidatus Dadabacteria bacterium]|nr:MAG: hypothetical protein D6719_04530 [Candidatus Dadabacteria bacterium]
MENKVGKYWTGFFSGVIFGLVVWGFIQFSQPVQGETGAYSQGIMAINGNINAEKQDVIYVFDTNGQKLAVYGVNNRGVMNLLDVRNVKYDLQLDFFKRQKPSVREIQIKVNKR